MWTHCVVQKPHCLRLEPRLTHKSRHRLCFSRTLFTIPPSAGKHTRDIPLSNLRETPLAATQPKRTGARHSRFEESPQNDSFRNFSDSEFSPWSEGGGGSPEGESDLDTNLGSRRGDDHHRRNSNSSVDGPGLSEKITLEDIIVPNPRHKPPSKGIRLLARIMPGGNGDQTALGLTGKPLLYAGPSFCT